MAHRWLTKGPSRDLVLLTDLDLAPGHDDLEMKLHVMARVGKVFGAFAAATLVSPLPDELAEQTKLTRKESGTSRLSITLWRLTKDWAQVIC